MNKKKLELLLGIISHNPSQRIVQFTCEETPLTDILVNFCLKNAYHFQIHCLNAGCHQDLSEKIKNEELISVSNLNLKRPSFMTQGKLYNYAFVTGSIPEEFRESFLQKTHKILLNAGNIVIFIPKKAYEERYDWNRLLEENYYVATNTIDDLCEDFDLIISKKMHGWGG